MYCSKCGKKVEETSVFCDGCGNPLKESETNQAKADKREKYFMDKQLKTFLGIIIYVILVLAFWLFSRANMFDFAFEELTLSQFWDMLIYISDMSQELAGFKVVCQFLVWVFRIGLFAYLGAVLLVFINRTREAKSCIAVGFICNLVVVLAVLIGMFICADDLAGSLYMRVDDVFGLFRECLKKSFYLYAVLNVALLLCGLRFFNEIEVGVVVQKQEMKWLIMKVIYTVLICYVWYQSQKQMFDIGYHYSMSIKDLVNTALDFSQEMPGVRISYWCLIGGKCVYILAIVLMWLQKEETAKTFFGLGFIFHFPIWVCVTRGLMIICGSMDYAYIMGRLNEEFWVYIALNIAVVICMAAFFSDIEERGYKKIKHVI